jgi:Arc/MetJ family transcription regulator
MRTTVNLDEELLAKASEYTGVKERSALLRMGLESLIAREAGRRLAALGGSQPDLKAPPRRRAPDFRNPE